MSWVQNACLVISGSCPAFAASTERQRNLLQLRVLWFDKTSAAGVCGCATRSVPCDGSPSCPVSWSSSALPYCPYLRHIESSVDQIADLVS